MFSWIITVPSNSFSTLAAAQRKLTVQNKLNFNRPELSYVLQLFKSALIVLPADQYPPGTDGPQTHWLLTDTAATYECRSLSKPATAAGKLHSLPSQSVDFKYLSMPVSGQTSRHINPVTYLTINLITLLKQLKLQFFNTGSCFHWHSCVYVITWLLRSEAQACCCCS